MVVQITRLIDTLQQQSDAGIFFQTTVFAGTSGKNRFQLA